MQMKWKIKCEKEIEMAREREREYERSRLLQECWNGNRLPPAWALQNQAAIRIIQLNSWTRQMIDELGLQASCAGFKVLHSTFACTFRRCVTLTSKVQPGDPVAGWRSPLLDLVPLPGWWNSFILSVILWSSDSFTAGEFHLDSASSTLHSLPPRFV